MRMGSFCMDCFITGLCNICWPIEHSDTGFGRLGNEYRCQVLLEMKISISIRPRHQRKDNRVDKTQWTHSSRFHAWSQGAWTILISTLSPRSGNLNFILNLTFTFIRKEDFWPLSNSTACIRLSPGKRLLMSLSDLGEGWYMEPPL